MDESRFLTTDDLSKLLKVSRSTIVRWRKAGMPYIKKTGGVRFDKEKVLMWLEENNK